VEGLKSFNLVFASHECACVDVLPELAVAAGLVRREPFVVSSWSEGSDGLSVTVNLEALNTCRRSTALLVSHE
jgi:hypothetical protein